MRQPNYKLGWFVPNQIAALTHFHSNVTQEDFMGVVEAGQQLLSDVMDVFHVIIDNRVVAMSAPVPLQQMKQMVSYMNQPWLRWVIVVKPEGLSVDTTDLPIEKDGETQLKNVSSLREAICFLREVSAGVMWSEADVTFFPRTVVDVSEC